MSLEMVESHSAIPSCDTYALLVLSKLSQASITGQTYPDHEPIAVITVEPERQNFFCLRLHANEAKGSIQWEMTR